MPKVSVRRGVFETNSSSVHAIAIKRTGPGQGYGESQMRDVREIHHVPIRDYGWEESLHYEPLDKLSYLWSAVVQCSVEVPGLSDAYEGLVELKGRWAKQTPEWWEDYLRRELELPEDVEFDRGEERIHVYGGDDGDDGDRTVRGFWGGIDHGRDLIEFVEAVAGNPLLLRDFVYGSGSYVWTGNDNDPSGPAVLDWDEGFPPLQGFWGGYERFVKYQ